MSQITATTKTPTLPNGCSPLSVTMWEWMSSLTLIYMGYFDCLFYMGGKKATPPSLTLAFDF